MNRIIKIGMDVHSNSFSLCALESLFGEDDRILAEVKVPAESRYIVQFIENLKKKNWAALANILLNAAMRLDALAILCIIS